MLRFLVLFPVVCWAAFLYAGEFAYENIGMGGAGGIFTPGIATADPTFMLCSSDMSGCYRSDDAGASWRMLPAGQISSAIHCKPFFHPKKPNVVVWKDRISTDKAWTWQPFARGNAPWRGALTHVACTGDAALAIIAGNEGGVWVSGDGGANWKQVDGGACGGIAVLLDGTVFAAAGSRLFRWRAGLSEPAPVPTEGVSGAITALAAGGSADAHTIHVVVSGAVHTSNDSGKTWRRTHSSGVADVVMAVNQHAVAYCNDRTRIFITKDGGSTWTSCFDMNSNVDRSWVQTESRWGYYIVKNGLSVCGSNPGLVVMSTQGDIYLSTDFGGQWRQIMNQRVGNAPSGPGGRYRSIGLEVTTTWDYIFHPADPNRHYICYSDIGFAYSVDRGATWSHGNRGCPWGNTFYGLVFDPFEPNRIYVACSGIHDIPQWTYCGANYGPGGVCLSEDHGVTWKPIISGLPQRFPACGIAVDPRSKPGAVILYVTMYGDGVYKSVDSGKTWTKKPGVGRPGNYHVYQVRTHQKTGNVYVNVGANRSGMTFSPNGGLWMSSDGGDSWTEITTTISLGWPNGFAVHPDNADIIYLVAGTYPRGAHGGVYKTIDGGRSWRHILTDADIGGFVHGMFVELHPDDPNVVYFGGTRGLWASPDAGASWRLIDEIPFGNIHRVRIDPNDKKTMYVTGFGGGVWRGPVLRGVPGEKTFVPPTAKPSAPTEPKPQKAPEPPKPSKEELEAAAKAAETALRNAVIDGVNAGNRVSAIVELMGNPVRAEIIAASQTGITVNAAGIDMDVPWDSLAPRRFYAIARRYSQDRAALAAYCRGNGLEEEAQAEEKSAPAE